MRTGPNRHSPYPTNVSEALEGTVRQQTALLALVIVALFVYVLQWVLLPFIIAGLLAYVFTPAVEYIAARLHKPRFASATAVFLALLAFAVALGVVGARPLFREVVDIVTNLQPTLETLARYTIGDQTIELFGQSMDAPRLARAAVGGLRQWIEQTGRIATLGTVVLAGVFGIFLTLVLLFYLLVSGPAIMRGVLWLVPPARRPLTQKILFRLDPVLRRYFVGVIAVFAYATGAAYVGLGLVLGIRHAVALALLTGLLELIPIIGPGTAAVVAGLVAVHYATGLWPIVAYAIYAVALRLSIDQFFGPLVLGSAARLHPVLIIFCLVSGGVTLGAAGVFLAIPAALATKVTLATLRDEPATEDVDRADEGRASP